MGAGGSAHRARNLHHLGEGTLHSSRWRFVQWNKPVILKGRRRHAQPFFREKKFPFLNSSFRRQIFLKTCKLYIVCIYFVLLQNHHIPEDLRKRAAVMPNHIEILQYQHIIMHIMYKSCNQSRENPQNSEHITGYFAAYTSPRVNLYNSRQTDGRTGYPESGLLTARVRPEKQPV